MEKWFLFIYLFIQFGLEQSEKENVMLIWDF